VQFCHAGAKQTSPREICLGSLPAGRQGPARQFRRQNLTGIFEKIEGGRILKGAYKKGKSGGSLFNSEALTLAMEG